MNRQSDGELSEQLNDKLNELWTDAAEKRKQLLRSKLPDYSRISESTSELAEKELLNLRQQLQQLVAQGRHKDLQIQRLRLTADQLVNQKRLLIQELEQSKSLIDENCPHALNQSSIGKVSRKQYQSSIKKLRNNSDKKQKNVQNKLAETVSQRRLLELLRSTSEYRSFVFYYDSHELSYLKRLQTQHKKNCSQPVSEKQRHYWAPAEVIEKIKRINKAFNLQLNLLEEQKLISRIKSLYQHNLQLRLKRLKNTYEERLRSTVRSGQNEVSYQIVQICRARQREYHRKRTNTLTK